MNSHVERRHRQLKPARPRVTIQVRKLCARLPGKLLPSLRSALETKCHRWRQGGPRGHEHYVETVRHYIRRGDQLFISARLVEYVSERLAEAGCRVVLDDPTTWVALAWADKSLLSSPALPYEDQELLRALSQSPRGQLLFWDQDDLARQLGLLCELLPTARVFIISKNNRDAQMLYRRLRRRLARSRKLFLDPIAAKGKPKGVLVANSSWFPVANPDDWDVLVFADTEAALAKHSIEALPNMEYQLLYCAVPTNHNMGLCTMFLLEEAYGRPVYQPPEQRPAQVRVLSIPFRSAKQARRKMSPLELKRHFNWHDQDRCQLVADVATRLAHGRISEVRQAGINVPDDVGSEDVPLDVAIMVETPEHGRNLLPLLPGWQLLHDIPSSSEDGALETYQVAVVGNTVVTASQAQLYGVCADVLIWAGGAQWPLTPDAFPRPAANQEEEDTVLLIDILDQSDSWFRENSKLRQQTFRELGWHVVKGPARHCKRN